jgi:plastocyanin
MRAGWWIAAAGIWAGAVLAALPTGAGARRGVTAVGVGEREFRISVYRPRLRPGPVRFNVANYGQDVHDLVVLAPGGRAVAGTGELRAGARVSVTARLTRPGRYRLLCTKADHAARGMTAALRVVRP